MQKLAELKITGIKSETAESKTLFLSAEPGVLDKYQAGQFLTLVFQTPFGEKRRSYSFSTSPSEEQIAITIKKVPNGEFSRPLVDGAKAGDVLLCAGVGGNFNASLAEHAEQVYFLAAGSGITPCFSLMKHFLLSSTKQVCLLYSNRTAKDIIFKQALDELCLQFPDRLQVVFLNSDAFRLQEKRLSHWLLPQLVHNTIRVDDSKTMFYLCGPFEYMQMAEITLRSRFAPEQIKKEQFDHSPRVRLPQPEDKNSYKVRIEGLGFETEVEAGYPVTVLKAALKAGMVLPYSCSAGRCAACVATCVEGKVWMAYNEVLTDNEVKAGRFLTCQAYPQGGDIRVEIGE